MCLLSILQLTGSVVDRSARNHCRRRDVVILSLLAVFAVAVEAMFDQANWKDTKMDGKKIKSVNIHSNSKQKQIEEERTK